VAVGGLALLLLPVTKGTAPWGPVALLVIAMCSFSWEIMWRWVGDRFLFWTVFASIAVRGALSVGFYVVSAFGIPLLEPLQLGGGFWSFAPDALHHHVFATKIVEAWRFGASLPEELGTTWYFLILAAAYKLMGIHPLHGAFLNTAVGTLSIVLAYSTARRLGGRSAGHVAALLMAFWPSLTLWSTQLLKEQIIVFLVLLVLSLMLRIFSEVTRFEGQRHVGLRFVLLLVGAATAISSVAMTRALYASAVFFSALLVIPVWAVLALYRKRAYEGGALILLMIVVFGSTFLGRSVEPLYLFSPRAPWAGHLLLGDVHLKEGGLRRAEEEFRRALRLNPKFKPAYERLAALLVADGRTKELAVLSPPSSQAAPYRPIPRKDADGGVLSEIKAIPERAQSLLLQLADFPATISSLRGDMRLKVGQLTSPGHSVIHPEADLSSYPAILAYLPQGLGTALFAPFPWQVLDDQGAAGRLKVLSFLEMLVIYILVFFGAIESWKLLRQWSAPGWFLVAYLSSGMVVLSLTMVNLGSLLRYRVPFLMALLVIASLGSLPRVLEVGGVHLLEVLGRRRSG